MKTQVAIDEFLQSRIARKLTVSTIQWYCERLEPFANMCPKLPTGPEPIEAYLAFQEGSPHTVHGSYRALRALYKFRAERHPKEKNPMAKIKPPRLPKRLKATLEPEEEMRLLQLPSSLRDRTILTLFIDTGIRTSELAGLREQDIGRETVKVYGKGKERKAPMSEETARLLSNLIATARPDEYLFHNPSGRLSRHAIYRIIRSHMEKAGIHGPKLGGHRLRHAFGKNYLAAGGDMRSLQILMGHASITQTEEYAELSQDDNIKKHHKYTPLRAAHAAAQQALFDTKEAVKEVETILTNGNNKGKRQKEE